MSKQPVKFKQTKIESLGYYLPQTVVSTKEVMKGCVNPIRFPLERLTGIKTRRKAGFKEFAIDLATKATQQCLDNSKYNPEDIDLVINCNISHYDAKNYFSFEPSSAVTLAKTFGMSNAIVFDISNACAGFFTGIHLAESFLKAGTVNRALVVSGEYITHLTDTAQKEIENIYDERMACLTLGDSGVAVVLERSEDESVGFHDLEMFTLGAHSSYCIAKSTDRPHGGAIMLTQSVKLHDVAILEGSKSVVNMIKAFDPNPISLFICHQTSKTSISNGTRMVNKFYGSKRFGTKNMIYNLAERGNTSTTTHMVGIMDFILKDKIHNGDNIAFSINASGVTLGSAIYKFDDLPDRIRYNVRNGLKTPKVEHITDAPYNVETPRVMIGGVAIVGDEIERNTFKMSKFVGDACMSDAGVEPNDVELLLFTGIYREDFICEPAIAALVAGDLKIRPDEYLETGNAFALDVLNGAIGFFNACQVGVNMVQSQKVKNTLIVTAEIENNKEFYPERKIGVEETAGSVYLVPSDNGTRGFGTFFIQKYTDFIDKRQTANQWQYDDGGKPCMIIWEDEDIETAYFQCAIDAIEKFMVNERLTFDKISKIFPPQISGNFITQLSQHFNLPKEKFIDLTSDKQDLFTASIPHTIHHAIKNDLVQEGDVGLLISVGSGIQVGCVLYHF